MCHGYPGSGFVRQDCEGSEGVVATPRRGGGNMGTRRHYACQLSFLFEDEGIFLVIW